MAGDELGELFVHAVTVETCTGHGAYGPIYADPVPDVPCYVEHRTQLVRDRTGAEVVSSTTIYAPPARAGLFTPESRVTLLPDHMPTASTLVLTAGALTSGGLGLPDHAVITCR